MCERIVFDMKVRGLAHGLESCVVLMHRYTRFEIVYSFDGILLLEIENLVHKCRRV